MFKSILSVLNTELFPKPKEYTMDKFGAVALFILCMFMAFDAYLSIPDMFNSSVMTAIWVCKFILMLISLAAAVYLHRRAKMRESSCVDYA